MAASRPRGKSDPARQAAAAVLLAVDVDGAYSNLLLPQLLRERGLSGGRDAAFGRHPRSFRCKRGMGGKRLAVSR